MSKIDTQRALAMALTMNSLSTGNLHCFCVHQVCTLQVDTGSGYKMFEWLCTSSSSKFVLPVLSMDAERKEKNTGEEDYQAKSKKPAFQSVRLGIWEVIFLAKSKAKYSTSFLESIPSSAAFVQEIISIRWLIVRMFKDVYSLAPHQLIIYVVLQLLHNVQQGMLLYTNSQIWIEVCLLSLNWL